ncbi:MAG TPA: hypothetical protein VJQ59_05825 [Candidatus Sulfotelmatobacter sp.]|nr:hypothetical protein [Candidatus Sulfotelmatobacter sp.]
MPILRVFLALLAAATAAAQNLPSQPTVEPLTADAIMARVAENQDRSEALRKEFVYRQHIHILTHKPGGRMMREETADYDVTPMPDGTEKKLTSLTGRYWQKGKYETFSGEPIPQEDSLDGGLVKDFRNDLADDKSKDGLGKDLFPLTSEEQKKYAFQLLGEETQDGRRVYHIGFRPKDKDEITWAGEAYIDAAEFEPVRVFTKLSRRIPFMIRTLLGTDVPGIGFNVVYQRQDDGVWFPATFGTEFRIRAVFFINREVSISLDNSGFERTHVKSTIKMVGPAQ